MRYCPRLRLPASMRTMYGTVSPSSVVVIARSAGGLAHAGSYAANDPVADDMYCQLYVVSRLHCASSASGMQYHGWICGPEKIGPPTRWFVMVSCAVRRPLPLAVTRLSPRRRP